MTADRTTRRDPARPAMALADPGRLAPHLERAWREDFIVELRLRGVPGDVIGDALVTADTHVQESGESAGEAFGDARTYAKEIAESGGTATAWTLSASEILGVVAGLLGMLATVAAFTAWLDGGPVMVTAGSLTALVVLLGLVILLVLRPTRILRLIVDHRRVVAILAPLLLTAGFVAILLLLPQSLLEVGALPVSLLGVCLLALSCLLAWRHVDADQVEITEPGRAPRTGVMARLGSVVVLPAMTAMLLVFTWTLSLLT